MIGSLGVVKETAADQAYALQPSRCSAAEGAELRGRRRLEHGDVDALVDPRDDAADSQGRAHGRPVGRGREAEAGVIGPYHLPGGHGSPCPSGRGG